MDEKESLGKILQRQRESKKITLKELSIKTKIMQHLLKAMEEDRYRDLPSATYVKGFLSAYAKAVGLDPKEILLQYEQLSQEKIPFQKEKKIEIKRKWNKKRIGVVGGVLLISILLSLFFHPYWSPFLKDSTPKKIERQTQPLTTLPPVQDPSPKEGKNSFSVKIEATERVWIRVSVDDQPEKEMILNPGEGDSYKASKQIYLHIGNAGGLKLTFNERRLENIGKSGEVVHLILTPQGWEFRSPEKRK
ncbi:MAG: helix-turn-helix domain-containing protein [Thermodesulfobacteriota bacterium]